MTKPTAGHGRVTTSRLSGVAGMTDGLPKPADIAEAICAIAYTDGKTGGIFAAALDVLAGRLQVSQQTLADALAAGIGSGWLRQGVGQEMGKGARRGVGQVELTAAGIYVAKLTLKLPT
jgi:hypothetical protein